MGSKAIYMKDLNGHFWISKWSPEQKLQRLILDGNLMKAKQFADHYGLEGETIKQKELEYLVRQDQKHSRIQELLNEIQGMASKISNIFRHVFTKISLGFGKLVFEAWKMRIFFLILVNGLKGRLTLNKSCLSILIHLPWRMICMIFIAMS